MQCIRRGESLEEEGTYKSSLHISTCIPSFVTGEEQKKLTSRETFVFVWKAASGKKLALL